MPQKGRGGRRAALRRIVGRRLALRTPESCHYIELTPPRQAGDTCVPGGSGSTSTSHPFDVGIPVPSVAWPMIRQVGGPYGTKIIPCGTFPSLHTKLAVPVSERTRTT